MLAHDLVTRYQVPLLTAGAVVALVVAVLLVFVVRRWVRRVPPGTPWWYYAGAAGGLAVSLNTSWRFFGDRLGVTGAERVVMFSVIELAFVACALGMRANVRHVDPATGRPGSAGAPRVVAWALCGLSGYAALVLSGPVDGVARVALGPVLSLVMLHLALGIEIRQGTGGRTGTWARVAGELRERVLSRLGLSDDHRDAASRTRERAVSRAARLALARRTPRRAARLARALRAAGVAHDPALRERLLAELAVLRCADQLATVDLASPWTPLPSAVPDSSDGHPELNPAPSETTFAGGVLDGVVLATHGDDAGITWTELAKSAAVDQADAVLPDRAPRALVVALGQVGVSVAETTVRRRRAQRQAGRPKHLDRILADAGPARIGDRGRP